MLDLIKALEQQVILPIIRLAEKQRCLTLCELIHQSGFECIEITLTSPHALELISRLAEQGVTVGAGTVLTLADAKAAVQAGAQYLISPGLNAEIVGFALKNSLPYIPGVFTPSEVMQALALGLTHLKLFPAEPLGTAHLKHFSGPFPQVKWFPTGGITFERIPDYLAAGAFAVGQGTRLVSAQALADEDWGTIQGELASIHAQTQLWKVGP